MSWFGQSPALHTEFHLLRWHCRIPIGNSLLYCPHNHPMKYSFFVSKYLSCRNRTDNNVSENGFCTHSHSHALPLTHAHVQCPLCLLTLEDFKGVFIWQPASWGSCPFFCGHQKDVPLWLIWCPIWATAKSSYRSPADRTSSSVKYAQMRYCTAGRQMDTAVIHFFAQICAFWTNRDIKVWGCEPPYLDLNCCSQYSGFT